MPIERSPLLEHCPKECELQAFQFARVINHVFVRSVVVKERGEWKVSQQIEAGMAAQASIMKVKSPTNAAAATGLLLEAAPVKAIGDDDGPTGVALGADALGADVVPTISG